MSRTAIPIEETAAPARRPHLGTLSSSALRHQGDERLVALTRAGSERAFAEIMWRYQRPLYVYCLQLLGAARAEDAVQQAFLQAFVALRDGASREIALRPWLYRIARNCSIDLLRKQGSDHDEFDPEYNGVSAPVAAAVVEQRENLAELVAAIQALPEGQRRALTLRELEGRSYGEISAELGHTSSGVRQLIFRARTALRNLAAFAFPIGSLRWRVLDQAAPGHSDPHQLAAAATLSSAGGGGALESVGSILAATFTLAVGGVVAPSEHRAAERAPVVREVAAAAPAPPYLARPGDEREATARQPRGRHPVDAWKHAVVPLPPVVAVVGEPVAANILSPSSAPAAVSPAPASQPALGPGEAQQSSTPGAGSSAGSAAGPQALSASAIDSGGRTPSGAAGSSTNGAPTKGTTGAGGPIQPAPSGGTQVEPGKAPVIPVKNGKPAKAPKAPKPPKPPPAAAR